MGRRKGLQAGDYDNDPASVVLGYTRELFNKFNPDPNFQPPPKQNFNNAPLYELDQDRLQPSSFKWTGAPPQNQGAMGMNSGMSGMSHMGGMSNMGGMSHTGTSGSRRVKSSSARQPARRRWGWGPIG